MTAKEQIEAIKKQFGSTIMFEVESDFYAFCEQLCKEQRQICAKLVYYKSENIVLNAPMPEI